MSDAATVGGILRKSLGTVNGNTEGNRMGEVLGGALGSLDIDGNSPE